MDQIETKTLNEHVRAVCGVVLGLWQCRRKGPAYTAADDAAELNNLTMSIFHNRAEQHLASQ
jgi:hypothetical protein